MGLDQRLQRASDLDPQGRFALRPLPLDGQRLLRGRQGVIGTPQLEVTERQIGECPGLEGAKVVPQPPQEAHPFLAGRQRFGIATQLAVQNADSCQFQRQPGLGLRVDLAKLPQDANGLQAGGQGLGARSVEAAQVPEAKGQVGEEIRVGFHQFTQDLHRFAVGGCCHLGPTEVVVDLGQVVEGGHQDEAVRGVAAHQVAQDPLRFQHGSQGFLMAARLIEPPAQVDQGPGPERRLGRQIRLHPAHHLSLQAQSLGQVAFAASCSSASTGTGAIRPAARAGDRSGTAAVSVMAATRSRGRGKSSARFARRIASRPWRSRKKLGNPEGICPRQAGSGRGGTPDCGRMV